MAVEYIWLIAATDPALTGDIIHTLLVAGPGNGAWKIRAAASRFLYFDSLKARNSPTRTGTCRKIRACKSNNGHLPPEDSNLVPVG